MAQELMHDITPPDHSGSHPLMYISLWILSVGCWVLGTNIGSMIDVAKDVNVLLETLFKLISIASLILIIAKNYEGGIAAIRKIFHKSKNNQSDNDKK